ncbi:PQQ-binding-like beta-propeller repeat protein [Roseospirillum parvum]|uniref:Outer membrane protein assembly factor BamB, contains PQQ-like beta-propeller repeat n=1 Tax=Roseospirillum parvum TaxID=83401 RepID=A0A1G8AJF4_9PROT|nr:PQQ-binding-like beta-propeller repeat protein [Roseospirillum parvum]SDH21071.1 Outer membrane protein assembly factor BamB, contains PQQ-like beta-propeller repeat [Roseospirillum parvum]
MRLTPWTGRHRRPVLLVLLALLLPGAAWAEPTVLWRFASGDPALVPILADQSGLVAAGRRSWGLDGEGRRLWQTDLPSPAHFRPRPGRLDGRPVVLIAGREGLALIDRGDGRVLWQEAPEREFGAPTVAGDRLLVGDENRLEVRALSDGQVLWTHTLGRGVIHYPPLVRDGVVYLGGGDRHLRAFRLADGKPLWAHDMSHPWTYLRRLDPGPDQGPIVAGAYEDALLGLDPATGAILWDHRSGNFINSFLVAQGRVHFWSPRGWMVALSATSGELLWRTRTHRFGRDGRADWSMVMAAPVRIGDHLAVLDMAGTVHLLDPAGGDERAAVRLPFPARPFLAPLANGDVIAADTAGTIHRLRLPSGAD